MNINIRGHEIELFETQKDWHLFIKDYNPKYIYSGELLSVPESVWHENLGFQNSTDLITAIRKQVFQHVDYLIIL